MSKIEKLDGATIVLQNGGVINIHESLDGIYNVDFEGSDKIRIGIPDEHGITYKFLKDVIAAAKSV